MNFILITKSVNKRKLIEETYKYIQIVKQKIKLNLLKLKDMH